MTIKIIKSLFFENTYYVKSLIQIIENKLKRNQIYFLNKFVGAIQPIVYNNVIR